MVGEIVVGLERRLGDVGYFEGEEGWMASWDDEAGRIMDMVFLCGFYCEWHCVAVISLF